MAQRLCDSWLEKAASAAAEILPVETQNFYIDFEVTETPDGKYRGHCEIVDAVPTNIRPGKLPKKTVEANANSAGVVAVSIKAKRFKALIDGELNPFAAFMRGEIKIDGDYELVVDELFTKANRQSWAKFRETVAAI